MQVGFINALLSESCVNYEIYFLITTIVSPQMYRARCYDGIMPLRVMWKTMADLYHDVITARMERNL